MLEVEASRVEAWEAKLGGMAVLEAAADDQPSTMTQRNLLLK
jgi:hypothetical protein